MHTYVEEETYEGVSNLGYDNYTDCMRNDTAECAFWPDKPYRRQSHVAIIYETYSVDLCPTSLCLLFEIKDVKCAPCNSTYWERILAIDAKNRLETTEYLDYKTNTACPSGCCTSE